MAMVRSLMVLVVVWLAGLLGARVCSAQAAVELPAGVKAVWDLDQAYHQTTPTRERICLNGLWRWQPAKAGVVEPPAGEWGYFKVPGCWPGITDYMQKDCQTLYAHPAWQSTPLRAVSTAWYQREMTIPAAWTGRRITVAAAYLNSYATVYVDGTPAGEMRFPGGDLDITTLCHPGRQQVLTMQVLALPLKAVMQSYGDTSAAKQVKGSVERRGLCGDVFLLATPAGPRLDDVQVDTSVRQWQITFNAAIGAAQADGVYMLQAQIRDNGNAVAEFKSMPFKTTDIHDGHFAFTNPWKPAKLWDLNTPGNLYEVQLLLCNPDGKVLDRFDPVRFGFREFWIDGRDFRLNGSRIFLSSVPLDNAQISAGMATYQNVRESLQRLKSFGINFVYTHNYGCEPGTHLSFAEVLQAADDEGMLVAFSQPHFGQYDWKTPDAAQTNGYAHHAAFYVGAAQNHPSVVMYAMSHNGCGNPDDMNPDRIDGTHNDRTPWAARGAALALRAEAIVRRLDPGRVVYHHSGGNLGAVYTNNFYANFAPIQEMSDWFGHWSQAGVKPLFLCEYGVPLAWDWAMYRGWYKGQRTFGSAQVPWQLCLAEWNAQFFGDRAFAITDLEKAVLRWEDKQFRTGKLWYRWDYPRDALSAGQLPLQQQIFAQYLTANLRAFRTLGVSGVCLWDHGGYWKLRDGVSRQRQELKVDWDHLQQPGFSPDYSDGQMEWINTAFERTDWLPTAAAEALFRNNGPLLAYVADGPVHLTGKDHNYMPGEKIQKQIVVINNSRQTVTCACQWSLALVPPITGTQRVTIATGEQERIGVELDVPLAAAPGCCQFTMNAAFNTGQTQTDTLAIDILPAPPPVKTTARIALYDPAGQTGSMLQAMGVACQPVAADADVAGYDLLIIGKGALSVDGPGPNLAAVRAGFKVVVFEQAGAVLERRLGFRVQEYGLRQVFMRVPDHPVLAGLTPENLHDWRGAATLLPPRLKYESTQLYQFAPTVQWCGIPVTRPWRCGNNGNVASVLIEKPVCGDFLPILDGGFGLQYSPLLEHRAGQGMVLFCQCDVTGRTATDPATARLSSNIIHYALAWKAAAPRSILYAGDPAGKKFLQDAGLTVGSYDGGRMAPDQVLVVGPGGGAALAGSRAAVGDLLQAHGHVLAIGLDEADANAFLPFKVTLKNAEHLASYFPAFASAAIFAGIGPGDVYDHDPDKLPLVATGAEVVDDGILAQANGVVFCQLVPWRIPYASQYNLKRTYCRASYAVLRVLANMGAPGPAPDLDRFANPVQPAGQEQRWLDGLYRDKPVEWDDPYRFFGW